MKIKTSELVGAALDWAVAKCEGLTPAIIRGRWFPHEITLRDAVGSRRVVCGGWHPSTNWAQCGPIIERERIAIRYETDWEVPNWGAWRVDVDDRQEIMGETPLIAAMRCYVASKLGAVVEVPDELVR